MNRTALIALAGGVVGLAALAAVIFWLTGPGGTEEGAPAGPEGTAQQQAAGPESPADGGPSAGQQAVDQESPAAVIQTGDTADTALPDGTAPPQQQEELPELPWQDGDLDDAEQAVAKSLGAIQAADPSLTLALTDLDWMADEVMPEETVAVSWLEEIVAADPDLARSVVDLPWLAERIDGGDLRVLEPLRGLARNNPGLARAVADSPWLGEGSPEDLENTLAVVEAIAGDDPALARRMVDSPEIADGLSAEDLAALTGSDNYFLERIQQEFPDLAETLLELPWVAESVSGPSSSVRPGAPASGLLAAPLPSQGDTDYEVWVLSDLRRLASYDEILAQRVAGFPWLADGVTREEARIVSLFLDFVRSPGLDEGVTARRLADLPWVADDINRTEARVLLSLEFWDVVRWELLLDQQWFQDGIGDEDWALVIASRSACRTSHLCTELLTAGEVRSETLELPSGEVSLYVVQRPIGSPIDDRIFEVMGNAVTVMEEFMGHPRPWEGGIWESPGVVMYREPSLGCLSDAGAYWAGDHFLVNSTDRQRTIFHEIAHYYFNSGNSTPRWLSEGGAQFLTAWVFHVNNSTGLESRYQQYADPRYVCDGAANIHQRNLATGWMPRSMWLPIRECDYQLGERFLLAFYLNLEQEIFQPAAQDLYGLGRPGGSPALTEDEIYEVFRSNTPPERQDEFRDLYQRLHGRPVGYEPPAATGDRAALLAIYQATDGPNWKRKRFWNTQAPLVMWEDVKAFRSDPGRVQGLFLWRNNLSGALPPELGNLPHLEDLSLSGNALQGPIPQELGNLTNLRTLILDDNQLTGPIPPELGNMSSLTILNLSVNGLSGPIPPELGNLTNLERLQLIDNQLTGPIPPELGNISNLRHLALNGNHLTGAIPPDLGNLSSLSSLNVAGNQLTGQIPPELASLDDHLSYLRLSYNGFTGCVPGRLPEVMGRDEFVRVGLPACDESLPDPGYAAGSAKGDRAALEALYHATNGPEWGENYNRGWLSEEDIAGWGGVQLSADGRVKWLDLGGHGLQGSLPAELGNLGALHTLRLGGNQLTGPIPPELGNLSNLELLDLSNNQLTGPIPPELGNLSSLKHALSLASNQLTGPIPPELAQLGPDLHLWGNQFTGCLPGVLYYRGWLSRDVGLPICIPEIAEEEAGTDLAALVALFRATDGHNWRFPDNYWFINTTMEGWRGVGLDQDGRVVELNLNNRGLTGTIPPELGNMSKLQRLKLSGNQLGGNIPKELGSLGSSADGTVYVDLWHNQLTGQIPPELAQLDGNWGLGGNQFTGCLPNGLEGRVGVSLRDLEMRLCVPEQEIDESGAATDRAALEALYHATNGANWKNSENWLTDKHLEYWVGVRLDSISEPDSPGRVRGLRLPNNGLTGTIPPELGNLSKLEVLNLKDNQLSGEIPKELGNMGSSGSAWFRVTVYLRNNQLTGCVPLELRSMKMSIGLPWC